ncbi:hypothetical protein J3Q64DRAFT_1657742 [Phycomyces blakesleeanus]|uniref:Phosphatidic acid phosphatase type 2/haloperoxidase domain-containing protein n=2 Tax=Phycomyces blakesleeanus TaxID=4837 RepID=A0ABR3B317_PHYBL
MKSWRLSAVTKSSILNHLPLKSHRWSYYDLKYVFLGLLVLIDFIIIRKPILPFRCAILAVFCIGLFVPYIRRFIVPASPIFAWLITFYACQFIPLHYRPQHIFVNILPTLERILYGASLSEIISSHTHPVLDVLAWLPYGVIHFSFPFVLAALLFTFGPPGCLSLFGQAFGYMNIAGVLTQLLFPNASPWYELIYGSAPADYSIPGEAGGLARIDKILGLELYGSTFGNSPLVFGAFPSLHSGSATMEMLFLTYLFPKMWPVGVAYTMWLWWSTMYLTHHYLIDLVGGSIYAFVVFFIARKFLPKMDKSAHSRLSYLGITRFSLKALFYSIEHKPDSFVMPDCSYVAIEIEHMTPSGRRRHGDDITREKLIPHKLDMGFMSSEEGEEEGTLYTSNTSAVPSGSSTPTLRSVSPSMISITEKPSKYSTAGP